MDKYSMWNHFERLHNHNKAKHNKTVCICIGISCTSSPVQLWLIYLHISRTGVRIDGIRHLESLKTSLRRHKGTHHFFFLDENGGTIAKRWLFQCLYVKLCFCQWTGQRIHNTLIVVDRYLRIKGYKAIPDSAEHRLKSFYPSFVVGIDLPYQGVVDSYKPARQCVECTLDKSVFGNPISPPWLKDCIYPMDNSIYKDKTHTSPFYLYKLYPHADGNDSLAAGCVGRDGLLTPVFCQLLRFT